MFGKHLRTARPHAELPTADPRRLNSARRAAFPSGFRDLNGHHHRTHVDHLSAERYIDHVRSAGFQAETVRNQGKGAAMQRIEAARRLFPSIWIDPEHFAGGLDALGNYHEKKDEVRGIGLGPEHDWSSHGADAFGLMAVANPLFLDRYDDFEDDEPVYHRRSDISTGYLGVPVPRQAVQNAAGIAAVLMHCSESISSLTDSQPFRFSIGPGIEGFRQKTICSVTSHDRCIHARRRPPSISRSRSG